MPRRHRDVLVIGTSAGGLGALDSLVGQLAGGLPAALFVVQHMSPQSTGEVLLSHLSRHGGFRCKLAEDGERFQQGSLYVAPPDHHLLVGKRTLKVSRGARENRYRPAIDTTFRSAAVAHDSHLVGVLLTGMLDDGTAGLAAIQRCGGIAVVQDPDDAEYPDMPANAAATWGWTIACRWQRWARCCRSSWPRRRPAASRYRVTRPPRPGSPSAC